MLVRCLFGLIGPFLFFSFLLSNEAPMAQHEQSILFNLSQNSSFEDLDTLITHSIFIDSTSYESDVYFQNDEFNYLVAIERKSWIKAEDLKKALNYLKLKNKFSSITIVLKNVQGGVQLHFILEGFWTFNRVKFYGAVLGKDKYRQYYALEPSEPFDIKKHTDCLEKIRMIFVQEGYFNAKVIDDLDYDSATKSVNVNIVFDPGIRYVIKKITLQIHDNENSLTNETELFTKKVIRRFGSQLDGALFSQNTIDTHVQYLKEYLAKKGFLNASLEVETISNHQQKLVDLIVNIHLQQRKKCTFFGNRFFSKKELLDQIMVFGDSMSLLPPSILSEELIQTYKKRGFWSIAIETKQQGNEYFFLVNEGPRACVSKVSIKGIKNFNAEELSRKFFGNFRKQKYFDADILKQSLKQFISFYLQEGFWDMKVLKQEYVALEKNNTFQLLVTIDEGPRRYLGACTIENYPELMDKEPFFATQQKVPIPFDLNLIHGQRQWLMRYFQEQGYLYAEVKPEIEEHDNTIRLAWHINLPETKVTFGKIVITGCSTFPFKHLMHRLECKQGNVWEKQKLEDSLTSLRSLDCFETIYIYPHNISLPELEKPIIVKLIKDDPFEVRLRVGFQQVGRNLTFRKGTTYRLGGSFLYRNPMNVGDYFYLSGDANRFYRYFSGTYFRPWSLYNPTNLILKGYANKYTQPVKIGSDKTLYNVKQQGFLIGLTRPYKIMDFGLNLGFEVMETRGLSFELAQAINFEPRLIDKGVPYIVFEPGVLVDYLDNKLNPTRGFLTALSAKGMFSWHHAAVTFFKVLAEQSVFIPLDPLVLGIRIRIGHIFNQKLSAIMPPERFFLGGAFSLRGYEPDFAPPLGVFVEDDGKRRLVPQGGKSMFNANVELRFWVYKNLGGTIFQDFGILSDTRFSDVKPHGLLAASGFGLRYETPIGPLRFDLGFKWKKRELEDSSVAWFLTFGNAF